MKRIFFFSFFYFRQSFDNDESRESSPLSMVGLEDFTRLPSLDSKIPQLSEKLRKVSPDPARKEVTFEKNAVVIPLGGESGNHKSGFTKCKCFTMICILPSMDL